MTTVIIGVRKLGKALAGALVAGGEPVVLAPRNVPDAIARQIGELAQAVTVSDAIGQAEVVIFAVWLDVMERLIAQHRTQLDGKVAC